MLKRLTNHDEFVSRINRLVGDEYSVLTKYTYSYWPVKMIHNKCGFSFEIFPTVFAYNPRCPHCYHVNNCLPNKYYENKLYKFLCSIFNDDNNIKIYCQYRTSECRNRIPLPFDFAIFNDDELSLLIECDEQHHFVKSGPTKDNVSINDNIKNLYCESNKIPLVRIPYYEFDNLRSYFYKEASIQINKYNLI